MEEIILATQWYNPGNLIGCIGIVAIQRENNKWKVYIGTGSGENKRSDSQLIGSWGTPVSRQIALATFPLLNPDDCLNDEIRL